MIRFLSIQRLAIIDQLELEFGPGLTVLTGETGAGKSILMEAIGLLLGGRASSDLVRTGEDNALVQAVLETPDGHELLIRREVSTQGRSRAFIDGGLVTTAQLRDAVAPLVDLHGQHEHQSLLSPQTQLDLLDHFADVENLRATVSALFQEWTGLREARSALAARERDKLSRIDLLTFQRDEIDKVSPKTAEDEQLTAERTVAANSDRLSRLSSESYEMLYESDDAVLARLRALWKRLGDLAALDARFQPFLDRRDAVQSELEELSFFLRDYASSIESSPDRLQHLEDRLAQIERLKRKYGPTLAEVLDHRATAAQELHALEHSAEEAADIDRRLHAARASYVTTARKLSTARQKAATRLSALLTESLEELAMPSTRCEFRFHSVLDVEEQWSDTGIDRAELYLSPNVGEELRSLARVASGGELSRIMLTLKTLASTDVPGKTLIFDEVDAGIGGRVADAVGSRLRRLAGKCQVFCITHLPQVAAYGQTHFLVTKRVQDARTVTQVERLKQDTRVEEIARMMGGRDVTPRMLAGARDMLQSRARDAAASGPAAKAKGEQETKGESERAKAKG